MGRLNGDMELVWAIIWPNFKLWEVYGKKRQCYPLYGEAMGMRYPYIFHSNGTFPLSTLSMEIMWDNHTILSHR